MKKSASPNQTEKRTKRTPEEKSARKSAKKASHATEDLTDDRASKKASQKKSLKSAAKQLQKELNGRMNEVVARIRKETKAKLKEVVKEATRRLDLDTERMFEQALHTIVRHYDSVPGNNSSVDDNQQAANEAGRGVGKKGTTLNKDGSLRKSRTLRDEAGDSDSQEPAIEGTASKTRGRNAGATAATKSVTGARRGPKPGTPATGARRGPKPRVKVTPSESSDAATPEGTAGQ